MFSPGEAICDVMAGVGPFAVPAGKKRCWVMANDLNPNSFLSLQDAVKKNKVWSLPDKAAFSINSLQVARFVVPSNEDGHAFIRSSTQTLLSQHVEVDVTPPPPRGSRKDPNATRNKPEVLTRPRTFSHFILNLPASALTFLPAFVGIYAGHNSLFYPHSETKLPTIHVYCFNLKSDSNEEAEKDICSEIGLQLGCEMASGNLEEDRKVSIWDVRDVAPKKRMFCASFRLPANVAFRER